MPRRLLAVVSTTKRTSPIRGVLGILSGLPPDEYEISLASLSSDPADNLTAAFAERGIRCESLALDGPRRWVPGRRVHDLVRRSQPQILYCTGLRPDVFAGAAGRACNTVARVSTLRNIPAEDYRNLYGKLLGSVAWRQHKRALIRNFHRVVPHATRMEKFLRAAGIPSQQLQVILNGGDFEGFAAPGAKRRAAAQSRIFGNTGDPGTVAAFVGELRSAKGPYDLVHAAAEVKQAGRRVSWLLIGAETEGPELRRLTRVLGVEANMVFLGFVNDVPGALAAADLFVHASHSEGLSRALLEAMAMGLPAIATDVSGTRDIIPDSSYGTVVPPKNPSALAHAILELVDDPERRSRVGSRGHDRVRTKFSSERMASEYDELFTRLLKRDASG